jgi:hypothetical protein
MGKALTFSDEALDQAQTELFANLLALEEMIQPHSDKKLEHVRIGLTSIHRRISWHFLLEEQTLDMAVKREPVLKEATHRIEEEHAQLIRSMHELIAEVEAANWLEDELRERVLKWISSIRSLEARGSGGHQRSEK